MKRLVVEGFMLCALLAVLLSCNSGSETENATKGITGSLILQNGQPAARTVVHLVPQDFNPIQLNAESTSLIYTDTTNDKGQFHINGIDSGNYNFEAKSLIGAAALWIPKVVMNGSLKELGPQKLVTPGKIIVSTEVSGDSSMGYYYRLGSTYIRKSNPKNTFDTLDAFPTGKVDSLFYHANNSLTADKSFGWGLVVSSDSILNISRTYQSWSQFKVVTINTTTTGILIAGTVVKLPLRVSLQALGYDFASDQKMGQEIRVSDEKGAPLPCEISAWNQVGKNGDLWVLVDTIAAGGLKKLRIYYGYTGSGIAPGAWPKGSVFSAANGFVGAWHFDSETMAQDSSLHDASSNGNDLKAFGYGASTQNSAGVLGNALSFNGTTQFLSLLKQMDTPDKFTLSGWFKSNSTSGGMLMEFTDADTSLNQLYGDRLIQLQTDGTLHYGLYPPIVPGLNMPTGGNYQILKSSNLLNEGTWHHFVARISNGGQSFFIDGKKVDENTSIHEGEHIRGYWRMGYGDANGWAPAGTSNFFAGALDEVWISNDAFNEDFIQLMYENQKSKSSLIMYPQ